ncbi:hypothetical protein MKZ38_001956 [Zalerion maritima]|uniref:Uncharacterized protein n=1 Tax=Zalerion maritima TaxID=339359 RepID=A0AAD5WSS6_9PEZI|nr:hypothetical protein MKZ38_001956 [Zalerion maritima]
MPPKKGSNVKTRAQNSTTKKPSAVARGGGTSKAARGGKKKAVLNQHAQIFREAHSTFEEEVNKACNKAKEELSLNVLEKTQIDVLRAAVDDAQGEKALGIYKNRLLLWTQHGGKMLEVYDRAEMYSQEHQHQDPPEIQRWDQDEKGMKDILDCGLEHSKKMIEHLLMTKNDPKQRYGGKDHAVRLEWSDEEIFEAATPPSEAQIIAEEKFGLKETPDGWGMVARGHLKTWVGLLRGAQDSGLVLENEGNTKQ